jgi:hypothetical protein
MPYDDVDNDVREGVSYHEQYQRLKGSTDYNVLLTSHAKPARDAQAGVKGAHRILWTDTWAKAEARPLLNLETREIPKRAAAVKNAVTCLMRFSVMVAMHSIAAYYAPQ